MFVDIVADVAAWFVLRGLDASVVDGAQSRAAQSNYAGSANRVAFVPSKEPLAILDEPTHIGEDDTGKRQLLNVQFVYEVSFAGYDSANPERDLAHRHVCFDLFEATVQAVQRSYFGAHRWTSARWDEDTGTQGNHGAELIATLTLNIPLFDIVSPLAAPTPIVGEPKPAPPAEPEPDPEP